MLKRRLATLRSHRDCRSWAGSTVAISASIIVTAWANAADVRRYVTELVTLAPDVILVSGASAFAPVVQATRTVPIVFVSVADPVGAGYVDSMARPGGNATGFIMFEYSLSGKWLGLLKEIAPHVTRAAVLRDPAITAGVGQFAVMSM